MSVYVRPRIFSIPPVRMTPVAGQRVIAVTVFVIVFVVSICLCMAIQAVESGCCTCRVTLRAGDVVISLERERMLERRWCPSRSVMALLTVGWKAQSRVVRSERVIIRVTRVAIRGNGLESPTYMAAYTIQAGMSADERKEVVLETAAAPARGSMTPFTAGCPAVRNVVRGYGLGEISLVTQLALHRSPPELTD